MNNICYKCNEEKDIIQFHKSKTNKSGFENQCKKCKIKRNIDGYKKDPERFKQYVKKFYYNNFEKVNSYHIKYHHDNKKERREYERKHHINNISFKLAHSVRSRIITSIKQYGGKKLTKSLELTGCNGHELKQYLESQFKPEMTWSNHGIIWEIDHIIPCSKFDLIDPEQQKQCFHFSNLQPLFKTTKIAESFGYKDYVGNRNKSNK